MRALTNDYRDCKIIKIDPADPTSPYAVMQEGCDPNDPTYRTRMFYLQRDGQWIDEVARSTRPDSESGDVLFESSAEALQFLSKLRGKPVVRDLPVSKDDVKNYLARVGSGSSAQELMRQFLARYRAAKGQPRQMTPAMISGAASRNAPARPSRWSAIVPAARWLRSYKPAWFRGDLVAGITLAAYLLPAGLGDASLANLPPEAGLYACLFGGLVFWLFCSSRHTTITVTSAISLLTGASLGGIAGGDTSRFSALAAGTAVLVACIAFTAWLVKAGSIVNFISESVMVGFKCGVALFLASTQLPKLFGIHGAHGNFWKNSGNFLTHLHETNLTSLTIGGVALMALVLGKIFVKNKPVALFVVVGGILASGWLGLEVRGVKLLGEVPQGLPAFGLPPIHWTDWDELLPLAFACFLLGAVETAAIGRMFTAKHGGRLDANQEFLALAASNLAVGLGRGFPVSGGMSQSLVNEGAGARTPLSGAFAAGIILVVVLFFSHLLAALPQPVLAAVVLVAVAGLFKVSALKHLWRGDRTEFFVAIAAIVGVLGEGLLRGVMIGAIMSLVLLIRRASRPHVAFLGRIPGTRRFSDRERHPDNELIPGVLIFRPESGLMYFNMDHVHDRIVDRVRAEAIVPALVVLDLSAAPRVDMHSAQMLGSLADELSASGIRLQAVEARSSVRERLRSERVDAKLGGIDRFSTVVDVVEASQKQTLSGKLP